MFLRRSLYIAALLVRTARRLSRLYCPHSCLMVSINLKVLVSTERITIQSSLTLLWVGGWDQPKKWIKLTITINISELKVYIYHSFDKDFVQ